jgi:hypothetical protein
MEKGIDERSGRMSGAWVYDETRRFAEHREIRVLVHDLERERFACHRRGRDCWDVDSNPIPVAHREVRARLPAVDRDVSVRNELLYVRA